MRTRGLVNWVNDDREKSSRAGGCRLALQQHAGHQAEFDLQMFGRSTGVGKVASCKNSGGHLEGLIAASVFSGAIFKKDQAP